MQSAFYSLYLVFCFYVVYVTTTDKDPFWRLKEKRIRMMQTAEAMRIAKKRGKFAFWYGKRWKTSQAFKKPVETRFFLVDFFNSPF
jgi:hypothetical protein